MISAQDKVLILDFGSQYTQLIARRVRELNIYCEIHPYNSNVSELGTFKAVILSGSPCSVSDDSRIDVDLDAILEIGPVLGVCYGAQYIADVNGGKVAKSQKREYGKASLLPASSDLLWNGVDATSQVWMSHADTILALGDGFEVIGSTENIPIAGYKYTESKYPVYGIQFHPEVTHSLDGLVILQNFLVDIAGCSQDWTPASFIDQAVQEIREKVGEESVLLGISGGVDSTVAALLIHKAIGSRLVSFFINNGLLRKNEYEEVLSGYKELGLNVQGIDASEAFLSELEGVSDPEKKRKAIGKTFIDVFLVEAKKQKEIKWLAQGTIYPDVIESVSVNGPSATIKSHHNVGGLPDYLDLKLLEPLRMLFKDEVRRLGTALKLPDSFVQRHPFPGPGLAIRVLGEISKEKIRLCQEADAIYIDLLKKHGWYDKIWQAGAILLPVKSVGVMGDERTYEFTCALRAVNSTDAMTAEWSKIPYELLAIISNEIINSVKGINRVVYDISTKPPATIEWE
ncbi:MAG: GMP synthase (glutamine-hydrolyzing) [Saprospiraceae bacterium]|jgi:GMP synthase (glutamine-hydrolysing)